MFLVNVEELEQRTRQDIRHGQLRDLCISEDGKIKEIYFKLDPNLEHAICSICDICPSFLFQFYWKKHFSHLEDTLLHQGIVSPSQVIESVWGPVQDALKEIVDNLISGKISLRHVAFIFKDYAGRSDLLYKEMSLVSQIIGSQQNPETWIKNTVEKINLFFSLQEHCNKATCILRIGETLNLQGDFSLFRDIAQQVSYFSSFEASQNILIRRYWGKNQAPAILHECTVQTIC